jgi:hypothetical protein
MKSFLTNKIKGFHHTYPVVVACSVPLGENEKMPARVFIFFGGRFFPPFYFSGNLIL